MTPTPLLLPPATFRRRLGAMLYDTLALIGLWFVVGGIAVGLHHGEAMPAASPAFQSVLLAVSYAYFAFCWRRSGQTLGMKTWRLRVVDAREGGRISLGQATVRFLVALVSWLPAGFGFWWALTNSERRGWPDRASGTRLVKVG